MADQSIEDATGNQSSKARTMRGARIADGAGSDRSRSPVLRMSLCASLLLPGCANQTLREGTTLATAGQVAASQMSSSVTLSNDTLQHARQALAFEDGYNGVFGASQGLQSQIAIYQRNLTLYSNMLLSLHSTYAALGSLSGYDAAGNFSASIAKLASDVNAFAAATGAGSPPVSAAAASVVGAIGGQILAQAQAQRVKKRSAEISAQLARIVAVLSEPGVRMRVVPGQELIQRDIDQAATALFDAHVYSYAPLIDELGESLGLKSLPDVDSIVAKNPRVQAGLRNVEEAQSAAQVEAIGQLYDANLAALRALQPLHKQLAEGQQFNTAAVFAIVSEIQAIADQIKQNSAAAPAAKGN